MLRKKDAARPSLRAASLEPGAYYRPSLLRIISLVADQPYGEVGLISELPSASLSSVLDEPPCKLTWSSGLLAIATDVAAGLAYLHGHGSAHGRLFPFNVLLTAAWNAKLAEYALDRFLAAAHGGQAAATGLVVLIHQKTTGDAQT